MSEDLSEEEKQKKQTRERMRQEYYFAIKEEGKRTSLFLEPVLKRAEDLPEESTKSLTKLYK